MREGTSSIKPSNLGMFADSPTCLPKRISLCSLFDSQISPASPVPEDQPEEEQHLEERKGEVQGPRKGLGESDMEKGGRQEAWMGLENQRREGQGEYVHERERIGNGNRGIQTLPGLMN